MSGAGRRNGFTLVEVMVALALTAMLALSAHAIIGGIIDAARRAQASAEATDRRMNGRQWLLTAVASADVGRSGFRGTADTLEFTTWSPTSGGWMAPVSAALLLAGDTVTLRLGARAIPIQDGVGAIRLDYLAEPGLSGVFVPAWNSPLSAPVAVRIRVFQAGTDPRVDTLLLPVGDRG